MLKLGYAFIITDIAVVDEGAWVAGDVEAGVHALGQHEAGQLLGDAHLDQRVVGLEARVVGELHLGPHPVGERRVLGGHAVLPVLGVLQPRLLGHVEHRVEDVQPLGHVGHDALVLVPAAELLEAERAVA